MRSLLIPEIGDEFILARNWTFTLHCEHRNLGLASILGYKMGITGGEDGRRTKEVWYSSSLPDFPTQPNLNYPLQENFKRGLFGGTDYDAWKKACRDLEKSSPEYQKFLKDVSEWHEMIRREGTSELEVTLRAGTRIKVDRVYIRKGASDFSSITWYAYDLGETTIVNAYRSTKKRSVKSPRFWTKLKDANNIRVV